MKVKKSKFENKTISELKKLIWNISFDYGLHKELAIVLCDQLLRLSSEPYSENVFEDIFMLHDISFDMIYQISISNITPEQKKELTEKFKYLYEECMGLIKKEKKGLDDESNRIY